MTTIAFGVLLVAGTAIIFLTIIGGIFERVGYDPRPGIVAGVALMLLGVAFKVNWSAVIGWLCALTECSGP